MSSLMIRQDITRIAQGNVQLVLVAMLDKIDKLEKSLDAMKSEPEICHGPDLELETLEGENDYVQRNLKGK